MEIKRARLFHLFGQVRLNSVGIVLVEGADEGGARHPEGAQNIFRDELMERHIGQSLNNVSKHPVALVAVEKFLAEAGRHLFLGAVHPAVEIAAAREGES
jgi:hypothetical protein